MNAAAEIFYTLLLLAGITVTILNLRDASWPGNDGLTRRERREYARQFQRQLSLRPPRQGRAAERARLLRLLGTRPPRRKP